MFWTRAIGLTILARLLVWPSFDFKGCGQIIGFGSAILFSQLFWLVQSQSDVFIAGRLFDPHALGLYAEALFLSQIFMAKFVPPLNEVAFPAYSRIKDDPAAMRRGFLKTVRLLMLVSAFAGVQTMRDVYNHAIAQKYRFFSYGDAMWLDRTTHND